LNTRGPEPVIASALRQTVPATGKYLRLLQFKGPVLPSWLQAVTAIPGLKVASRVNEQGVLSDWTKPVFEVRYPVLITQIDTDGNEIAGIRLPEIAVPLATHTGWNEYARPHPEGELCDRDGSYAPFAATRAERIAKNDPRLSLEERYGDHAGYVKKFTEATEQLVAARLLLREDADLLIAKARSAETAKRFGR